MDSKPNEMEIASPEENLYQPTAEDNKDVEDGSENSLWKWPSNKSCLAKVF